MSTIWPRRRSKSETNNNLRTIPLVLAFVAIGYFGLHATHAATYIFSTEAENGLVTGNAQIISTEAQASGGKHVKFGSPTAIAPGIVGFNASNEGMVYISHINQLSVTASDPSRPFRTAKANNVKLMRVFSWNSVTINTWKSNPSTAMSDLLRMCNDAKANGVQLILSPRLDQNDIQAITGKTYASWAAARQDLITPGSAGYITYENLMKQTVQTLSGNTCVYSYEVVNEPSYMLGADDGSITEDQMVTFVDHMQSVLKAAGAVRVNSGSWPFYDPSLVSDQQIITFMRNADIIDAHLYPPDPVNTSLSTVAQANSMLTQNDTYVARVRSLLGKPTMPAMVGEAGTLPWPDWSQTIINGSRSRGWTVLPWGFDAYDANAFTETTRPEVLSYIKSLNP